jgi:hypothetical protein
MGRAYNAHGGMMSTKFWATSLKKKPFRRPSHAWKDNIRTDCPHEPKHLKILYSVFKFDQNI